MRCAAVADRRIVQLAGALPRVSNEFLDELTGSVLEMAKMFGPVATSTIGAKSFAGSYASFEYKYGAVASGPVKDNPIVAPSGADFATSFVPTVPPAAARFSTTTA